MNNIIPKIGNVEDIICKDIDKDGHGISEWNEWILVTPDLIPGEKAAVKIEYKSGSRWYTSLSNRKNESQSRCQPLCSIAETCGSCTTQHITGEEQWSLKVRNLKHIIQSIIKLDIRVDSILYSKGDSYGYRNRALVPIHISNRKELLIGYYKLKTHTIVDLNICTVLDTRLSSLLYLIKNDIQDFIKHNKFPSLHLTSLRHICLRLATNTDQILITLVSKKKYLISYTQIANLWVDKFPFVSGVTLNIQSDNNNRVFGRNTFKLAGQDHVEDIFCGLKFILGTTTFFQVNSSQAEKIVKHIVHWIELDKSIKSVIDAYCGVGAISLPIAKKHLFVIGIEIHEQSVIQARRNASLNNIKNCKFHNGDVKALLDKFIKTNTALIIDPPRKGLDPEVISIILKKLPIKIAYLSCNPVTLARDLKALIVNRSYKVEIIYPIDFFPQTTHLECLALISRTNF